MSKDPWPGDATRPQTLNGWSYVENNPVNRIDPTGWQSDCPGTACGPDVTAWFMTEMEEHVAYGKRVRNTADAMWIESLTSATLNPTLPTLGRLAQTSPFNEIVYGFGVEDVVVDGTLLGSAATVGKLLILEYALYGLAVDYSTVDCYNRWSERFTIIGNGSCGDLRCSFSVPRPGEQGVDMHQSVTLCGECIDASDLGNIMFGAGGWARGYTPDQTFASASTYNVLNDVLKPLKNLDFGSVSNPFNQDPRGAIPGYFTAMLAAYNDQNLFCSIINGFRFIGYNENVDQASQCPGCTTEYLAPSSGHLEPSSLNYVSGKRGTTVNELERLSPIPIPWLFGKFD